MTVDNALHDGRFLLGENVLSGAPLAIPIDQGLIVVAPRDQHGDIVRQVAKSRSGVRIVVTQESGLSTSTTTPSIYRIGDGVTQSVAMSISSDTNGDALRLLDSMSHYLPGQSSLLLVDPDITSSREVSRDVDYVVGSIAARTDHIIVTDTALASSGQLPYFLRAWLRLPPIRYIPVLPDRPGSAHILVTRRHGEPDKQVFFDPNGHPDINE